MVRAIVSTDVLVELHELGKTYDGEAWAVKGVSLTVPQGSIFGLIGPNGAGKSTTLRMIATAMAPTEGEVRFDGKPVPDEPTTLRKSIGFLGDGNPLYKDMSPSEYLRFFGQCYGLRSEELEAAIVNTLHTFDLSAKAEAPCGSLSKGMRQRVLIARCLLHRPRLLILDEPADGLDPRGRADLRKIIARVRDSGVTVVISSHILRELDDLCDEVAILQKGKVVVAGPVDRVIEDYDVDRFTYRFRILEGIDKAREVLAARRALIEGEGLDEGLDTLFVRVLGGEPLVADLLAALVGAGVKVVTVSREKSRLEDVYARISEDQVN